MTLAPVYRKLQEHLDATPNGYPSTESGVDLRLLAKIFEPEEAALALCLCLEPESVETIAERAGLDASGAQSRLLTMVDKGQISGGARHSQRWFQLLPFAVGFYEEQLPHMDLELATLVEEYYQETHGALTRHAPSIHRVIPVGEAIPFDLEIYAYEKAASIVDKARSWGVRDCICRVQQHLIGKGCDAPIENCLVLAPVPNAFDDSDVDRAISKEEALQILQEAEDAGLVHSTGNFRRSNPYICNCCTCCCGVLRGVAEFGVPSAVAKSDFQAVVDDVLCIGCEQCLERCSFGALSMVDGCSVVDLQRCVGCGLCATVCPVDALSLQRRPQGEVAAPPANITKWRKERMAARDQE